jgi:hypothetical protein
MSQDQAALLTRAILSIVTEALLTDDVRQYVESLVRDELDAVKRQVSAERIAGTD